MIFWLEAVGLAGLCFVLGIIVQREKSNKNLKVVLEALAKLGRDEEIKSLYLEGQWEPLGEALRQMGEASAHRLRTVDEEKSKVETILTHMVDGVVLFNGRKRVALLNPAVKEILGGGAEMIGAYGLELYRHLALDESLGRVLATGEGETVEVTLHHPREKTVLVFISPVAVEEATGALMVFRDVSQERAVEKMRREFVADVTHELQTPLTSIIGYVETLLDGGAEVDRSTRIHFLQVIQDEAGRLSRLLADLLDLSRIQAGAFFHRHEILDLRGVVEEVAGRFRSQAQRGGHRLEVDGGERELPVQGDADRLGQVLLNLLTNAAKYTPPGGRIRAKAKAIDRWAAVAVEDDGIGIPPEELPRVFERFYRVDKGRSRESGGTGIGLAIVKGIVVGYGGKVEAKSEVGKGSTFTFYLPLEEGAEK